MPLSAYTTLSKKGDTLCWPQGETAVLLVVPQQTAGCVTIKLLHGMRSLLDVPRLLPQEVQTSDDTRHSLALELVGHMTVNPVPLTQQRTGASYILALRAVVDRAGLVDFLTHASICGELHTASSAGALRKMRQSMHRVLHLQTKMPYRLAAATAAPQMTCVQPGFICHRP